MSDWWRGSSILMKEQGQWVELAGHDYVMDLIADMELPMDFPKQKSYFIISTDNPAKVRANASLLVCKMHTCSSLLTWLKLHHVAHYSSLLSSLSALFGSGFDSDEELPSSLPLSSSRPAYSLPDSDGYYSHGTHTQLTLNCITEFLSTYKLKIFKWSDQMYKLIFLWIEAPIGCCF